MLPDFSWNWFAAFLGSALSFLVGLWTGHMQRRASTDGKVHDKRYEKMAELVRITAPLAVYFPTGQISADEKDAAIRDRKLQALTPQVCAAMGKAASHWYFAEGGILMGRQSRNVYMLLLRALTMASRAKALRVPGMPQDSTLISDGQLTAYRAELLGELSASDARQAQWAPFNSWLGRALRMMLEGDYPVVGNIRSRQAEGLASPAVVAAYEFGREVPSDAPPHQRFRDYVFLQNLSSQLRTALTKDLHSRRRPE